MVLGILRTYTAIYLIPLPFHARAAYAMTRLAVTCDRDAYIVTGT